MTKNVLLGTLAAVVGVSLCWQGILILGQRDWLGILLLTGAMTIWLLIAFARANRNPFTPNQMRSFQDLIQKERLSIKAAKQQIIDEGAKVGDVVSTENILKKLDALKASYDGPNREEYFAYIDKMSADFREKYGPTIPVDVAFRLLTEYEEKNDPLRD